MDYSANSNIDNTRSVSYRRAVVPIRKRVPLQHPANPHPDEHITGGLSQTKDTTHPLLADWCTLLNESHSNGNGVISLERLCKLVTNQSGKELPFRSVCWRLFLGILSVDTSHWRGMLTRERQRYAEINSRTNPDLHNLGIQDDHPLSQEPFSLWNRYFRTNRIKRMIAQDVDRTFPKVDYFRNPQVQEAMVNVLFSYCEHFAFQYRQGMHEILAPLFFVLHQDYCIFDKAQHDVDRESYSNMDYHLGIAINSKYFEADAFCMFCTIMNNIQLWYITDENQMERDKFRLSSEQIVLRMNSYIDGGGRRNCTDSNACNGKANKLRFKKGVLDPPTELLFEPYGSVPTNPGTVYVDSVHSDILRQVNEEVYSHLQQLEILPALFGIRWIRLLFGHEYELLDLLFIWDCIFFIGDKFIMVKFLYVSMLVSLGPRLINCTFSECLYLLMHYPVNSSSTTTVQHIIRMALHLYKPDSYPAPVFESKYQNIRPLQRLRRLRATSLTSDPAWQPQDGEDSRTKTARSMTLLRRRIPDAFRQLTRPINSPRLNTRTIKPAVLPQSEEERPDRNRSQNNSANRNLTLTNSLTETFKQALRFGLNQSAKSPAALRNLRAKGWTGSSADISRAGQGLEVEPANSVQEDFTTQSRMALHIDYLKRLSIHLNSCATLITSVLKSHVYEHRNPSTFYINLDAMSEDQRWQTLVHLKLAKAQIDEAHVIVSKISQLNLLSQPQESNIPNSQQTQPNAEDHLYVVSGTPRSSQPQCNNTVTSTHFSRHIAKEQKQTEQDFTMSQSRDIQVTSSQPSNPNLTILPALETPSSNELSAHQWSLCQSSNDSDRDFGVTTDKLGKPGSLVAMTMFSPVKYAQEVGEDDCHNQE